VIRVIRGKIFAKINDFKLLHCSVAEPLLKSELAAKEHKVHKRRQNHVGKILGGKYETAVRHIRKSLVLDALWVLCEQFGMKLVGTFLTVWAVAVCGALSVRAQEQKSETSRQDSGSDGTAYRASIEPVPLDLNRLDISPSSGQRKWTLRSLFAHPLKTLQPKKIATLPLRLLKPLNPFAPIEPEDMRPGRGDYNPRAWTTVAGWSPGSSAFPTREHTGIIWGIDVG